MDEIEQYDYQLPRELIAQFPLPNRSDSRLLVADRARGTLDHLHVRDLPEVLRAGDVLVLNDTRVIPARLVGFRTATHGRWVGLFVEADAAGNWRVLGHTRGRLRVGETITLLGRQRNERLVVELLARLEDGSDIVRPLPSPPTAAASAAASPLDPHALLERVGRVPLPPYIRDGEMTDEDLARYQTVYARTPGAIAAPTAGLHFTEQLFERLTQRGVERAHVTLHVGVGTFRPISVANVSQHPMHSEWGSISADTARQLSEARRRGGRVVAVGTTSLRVLETAAASGTLAAWSGSTNLFIRPPFQFHAADALLTNFHLPRSTLLVLVRTFGGDALLRRAYQAAIDERYRFYSYGDAMLIL